MFNQRPNMKLHLSKPQWLGVSLLILLVMLVLIEHLLYGGDPAKQDLNRALAAPSWGEPLG
ncbi:ABC transporter permease, partial [Vibrio cholerae]|nr:ABC transporter permease [Vibrio cholerae]